VPINLVAIVIAQVITLAIIMRLFGRRSRLTLSEWQLAIGVGVGVGLLMDTILGMYGVFAYLPQGANAGHVSPRDLPLQVMLFNVLASYGIASATVSSLSDRFLSRYPPSRRWIAVCGAVTLCGELGILMLPLGSIWVLFAWGVIIVSVGEVVLYTDGKAGPFLSLLAARDWRPFGRFWLFCASVGAIYELVNSLLPFWVWLPESQVSSEVVKPLIVVVGYLALFHPLLVLFVLLSTERRVHNDT
jgi:hypothetical protein